MNPIEFQEECQRQGFPITEEKMAQFATYFSLLVEWNQKINLTAITEKEDVYLKHFYDSITAGSYVDFEQEEPKLCDVGAGAGFPSIPLKILYPNLQVTIVDSLKKRISFLEELVRELGLENVELVHDRAETFGQNKNYRESFDFVTARAVAKMSVLAEYCLPLTKKYGSFVAMKAAHAPEELDEAAKAIATLGGKVQDTFAFDLPKDAGERHIILIEKRKETPNKYPRKPGTPNKKPL